MTGVNHTLKDIRPKAEEKARRKAEGLQQEAPPGDGFMSERTRAKEALREEVNTYTGANVRKIAATTAAAEEERILRVAAYCRVSTDDIDQLMILLPNHLLPLISPISTIVFGRSDHNPRSKGPGFFLTIWCIYNIIQKDYYIVSFSADTGIVHFPVA